MEVVFIILLLILIFLLTRRIKVELIYSKGNHENHLNYRVSMLNGLIRLERKAAFKVKEAELAVGVKTVSAVGERTKSDVEIKELLQKIRTFLKSFDRLMAFTKNSLRKVRLVESNFVCNIGSGDAGTTAQYVGLVWSLYGSAMSMIQNTFYVIGQHDVVVHPDFNKKTFQLTYGCIFDFRLGYFIFIAIQFVLKWKGRRIYLIVPAIW